MDASANPQDRGVIGRVMEDGRPVIYKFVEEMPSPTVRDALPWLTVIAWRYDGSERNGMPPEPVNERMIRLEDAVEASIERDGVLRHVYSRTGNDLKELVYYIHDRDQFLAALNDALADHPRYPIEINFYEDRTWEDFQRLLSDFDGAPDATD
ncbi:DUF695 domain-containing protein [Marinobacter bohaiensis]|uniref:DUF695 domain-containing protein n=1 Tax=Marinobacter bohaiensis TaxID=2201898 RepID=UPI001D178DF9|nr:DUF695 domain-containing protein [Marinobacter bohaiensis]